MKYFVKCYTDWGGTDSFTVIDSINEKDAEIQAQELAKDNYDSYSNIWEEEQEECEKDGFNWIDGEHYDYELEEYNSEKHDMYL